MAGGTDGELITYDTLGDPAKVAVGTSGHVLTSGGAGVAPTFQAAAAGGVDGIVSTADATAITIDSSENVGIGMTSNLQHKLAFAENGAVGWQTSAGTNKADIKFETGGDTLQFSTTGTARLKLTTDGRGLSQFTAKAWCNFDGSGSAASWERDSHNVSSYVDNGTGNYTVNFSNNMANANYSVGIVAWNGTSHGDFQAVDAAVVSTSSIIIKTGYVNATNSSMAAHNVTNVNLLVFGD
jgi:hypothetical protein